MRYVLRADASHSIGAGQVMRSSAIAEELIAQGEDVVFVGQISDLPWVEERIRSLGFVLVHNEANEFISSIFPPEKVCMEIAGEWVMGSPKNAITELWGEQVA